MPCDEPGPLVAFEMLENIPLYLIPKTISDQIRTKRKSIVQIVVDRKFQNRYTVRIETREAPTARDTPKELPDHG